jgi:hypothetical protein
MAVLGWIEDEARERARAGNQTIGLAFEEIASELGMSSTWSITDGWRYWRNRVPRRPVIVKLANLLKRRESEIYSPREEKGQEAPDQIVRDLLLALKMDEGDVDRLGEAQVNAAAQAALAVARSFLPK